MQAKRNKAHEIRNKVTKTKSISGIVHVFWCKKSLTQNSNYVSVDDGLLKIQTDYLPKLKRLIEMESIQAVIDSIYPLDNIIQAHK